MASRDTLSTLAARARGLPLKFNDTMAQLASLVKTYVDALDPSTTITTRGDLIRGNSSGNAERVALGTTGQVLKSDGTDAVWGTLDENNMDEDMIRIASGTLTQANLLALSTPVTLIAAPGAGKVIVVDEIELLHTYSTAAYATGSDVSIEYATSGDNIALVVDSFVTAGASANAIIKPSTYDLDGSTGTGSGFNVTANANKAVQVTASDFTNGNAANIVKWRIRYHVVTLLT
jgi:hypothetical protein